MNGARVQNEFQVLGQVEEVPSLNDNRDASLKEWKSWRLPIIHRILNYTLNSQRQLFKAVNSSANSTTKMHQIAKNFPPKCKKFL